MPPHVNLWLRLGHSGGRNGLYTITETCSDIVGQQEGKNMMSRNTITTEPGGNSTSYWTKTNFIETASVDISTFQCLNEYFLSSHDDTGVRKQNINLQIQTSEIKTKYVKLRSLIREHMQINGCCLPIVQSRQPVGWGGPKKGWDLANSLGLLLWLVGSVGLQQGLAAGSPPSVHPSLHSWCLLSWRHVHQTSLHVLLKNKTLYSMKP